jgi:hypothetical protein
MVLTALFRRAIVRSSEKYSAGEYGTDNAALSFCFAVIAHPM